MFGEIPAIAIRMIERVVCDDTISDYVRRCWMLIMVMLLRCGIPASSVCAVLSAEPCKRAGTVLTPAPIGPAGSINSSI